MASVSLPLVSSPSPSRMNTTTGSSKGRSKRQAPEGFGGTAGPGTWGSAQYITKMEQQLMGSKKSEDRMSTRVQKLEDELFTIRAQSARLRMTGTEDAEDADQRATRMALERSRRELKTQTKDSSRIEKVYQGRVRLLEETVGDVQTELTKAVNELKFLRHRHEVMTKENQYADLRRTAAERDKQRWKEEAEGESATSVLTIDSLTTERDKLAVQFKELQTSSKSTTASLERELKTALAQLKPLEAASDKAARLEDQVKELNEARQARKLYEEKARAMEERLDKILALRKSDQAQVTGLEAAKAELEAENAELKVRAPPAPPSAAGPTAWWLPAPKCRRCRLTPCTYELHTVNI
jgi:chromosome segregation ATPase